MQNFIWSNQISQKNSLCTRSPLELFLGQHNTFSSYIKLPSQLRYDFVIYTLWWSFSSWNTSTASMILRHLFAIQINTFNAQSFHNTLQSDYLVAELVRLGWHHWCFVCVSSIHCEKQHVLPHDLWRPNQIWWRFLTFMTMFLKYMYGVIPI